MGGRGLVGGQLGVFKGLQDCGRFFSELYWGTNHYFCLFNSVNITPDTTTFAAARQYVFGVIPAGAIYAIKSRSGLVLNGATTIGTFSPDNSLIFLKIDRPSQHS